MGTVFMRLRRIVGIQYDGLPGAKRLTGLNVSNAYSASRLLVSSRRA